MKGAAPEGTTSTREGGRETWVREAACRTRWADPRKADEFFFPEGGWEFKSRYDTAKQFCRTQCPVMPTCLADALAREALIGNRTLFGVVGGCDPDQRLRILDEQAKRAAEQQGRAA